MTRTAKSTKHMHFEALERQQSADDCGFTLKQWDNLPGYVRDELTANHRKIKTLTARVKELDEAQDPTCQWYGWRPDEFTYLPEDTIHFGDVPRQSLMHVRWLPGHTGEDSVLAVFGSDLIQVEPRTGNHVVIRLRDY